MARHTGGVRGEGVFGVIKGLPRSVRHRQWLCLFGMRPNEEVAGGAEVGVARGIAGIVFLSRARSLSLARALSLFRFSLLWQLLELHRKHYGSPYRRER